MDKQFENSSLSVEQRDSEVNDFNGFVKVDIGFCLKEEITRVMKHLTGYLNSLKEKESRLSLVSTEWMLERVSFQLVWGKYAPKDRVSFQLVGGKFVPKGVRDCDLF